jgi:hypothetical protein
MSILCIFSTIDAYKSVIRDLQSLAELCFIILLLKYIFLGRSSSYEIIWETMSNCAYTYLKSLLESD